MSRPRMLRSRQTGRCWALTIALVFSAVFQITGSAQDASPDLRVLRTQLRADMLAALLPEKKKLVTDLLTLEKKLAEAQDFAGAIRARDERLALEREILQFENEVAAINRSTSKKLPERIMLKWDAAKFEAVTLDAKDSTVSGWDQPGAAASWTLPGLPPGGYEILLRYKADLPVPGIKIKESFYYLDCELPPVKKGSVEKNLGTLRVSDGSGSLTLTAPASEQSASLHVYSLVLRPVAR